MSISQENLIFGFHVVSSLLNKKPKQIIEIFLKSSRDDDRIKKIVKLASINNIPIHHKTFDDLQSLVNTDKHQGIVARVHETTALKEHDLNQLLSELSEPPFLLILDNIKDPHNLGACLRSADAFGVHAVIAPKDRSVGITSVVRKVSSGASENVPFVQVTNLVRTIKELQKQNIWVVGTADEVEDSLFEADLTGPIAIVMGSEGEGLRRLTKEYCDNLVHIPMFGSVSSLNVSVATGIFLFEALRQRNN